MVLVEKCQKRRKSAVVETVVTVFGGITGNVSECPNTSKKSAFVSSSKQAVDVRLLPDIGVVGAQQLNEVRHGSSIDYSLGVFRGTRGNVWKGMVKACSRWIRTLEDGSRLTGQSPCGFKLQDGVGTAQELDESVDDAAFDDPIYRRILLLGEKPFKQ